MGRSPQPAKTSRIQSSQQLSNNSQPASPYQGLNPVGYITIGGRELPAYAVKDIESYYYKHIKPLGTQDEFNDYLFMTWQSQPGVLLINRYMNPQAHAPIEDQLEIQSEIDRLLKQYEALGGDDE